MKKKIIIIVVIVVVGVIAMLFLGDPEADTPSFFGGSFSPENNDFITSNPLYLEQIKAISKFRSCEGHDYSGKNADGEAETNRSMKNYIDAVDSLARTTNQVKVFAPFDGEVSRIEIDQNPRGVQVWLSPKGGGDWKFIFFHIDLLPGIGEGTKVSSGELMGYANLANAANFDMALKSFGFSQRFYSVFSYMAEPVIQQYQARGLTADTIVVTKELRDADPCNFDNGRDQDGWVVLQ